VTREARTELGSPTKSGRQRTAAKGRVCEVSGCDTVLSIYNALDTCSAHELPRLKPSRPRP
jgi:hypothetical protein